MKAQPIICALFACTLSAQAGSPSLPPAVPPPGRPIARVNGTILTDRDLQREMRSIFPYTNQHGGDLPKAMEPKIRRGALQMIEFQELLYQEAVRRKLSVPASEMDRAWAEFRKEFPNPAAYREFLKQEVNGSEELARTKIRRSILIDKITKIEITDKAAVSAAGLREYYDKHPAEFRVPEAYALQTISMVPPPKATPAQLDEAYRRANQALKQAQATKSYEQFGLLAEKLSEDPYRVMMGDHKTTDRSKLPAPILKAIGTMQPGEISGLLQVDQAFVIVRFNRHTPAGMQKFDEVRDELRKNLEKTRTEQIRSALGQRLRAKAKIEEL